MTDVWQNQHPTNRTFSNPSRKHRIDFLFIKKTWTVHMSFYINPLVTGSNHFSPALTLQTSTETMGKEHWKLTPFMAADAPRQARSALLRFIALPQKQKLNQFNDLLWKITNAGRALHRQQYINDESRKVRHIQCDVSAT